jgi:hypothetical protein
VSVPTESVALVIGTGATVGATIIVSLRWFVSSLIRDDVQPLRETMVQLTANVGVLTDAMREAKLLHHKDVEQSQRTTDAIYEMLRNHETRIRDLERPTPPRAKLRVTK